MIDLSFFKVRNASKLFNFDQQEFGKNPKF